MNINQRQLSRDMRVSLVLLTVVGLVVLALAISRPLWAQSSTLPSGLEIRATLCPCEVVLLDAPNGVHKVLAEFSDNAPADIDLFIGAGGSSSPPSRDWIFTPGVNSTITQVTRRQVWQFSMVDNLNEINRGDREVVLFTMEIPLTAALTKIVIEDDDRNVVVMWP